MTSPEDFLIQNGVLAVYKGYGGLVDVPEGVTKIGKGPSAAARAWSG